MKLLLLVGAALAATGCSSVIELDGSQEPTIREARQVSAFMAVKVLGAADVSIGIGKERKVTIEGREVDVKSTTLEVKGDALLISQKKGTRNMKGVKVHITIPDLKSVAIHGAGDVSARGVKGKELAVVISGAGDLDLEGSVHRLQIEITGAGDIKADKLKSDAVSVLILGAGDAHVRAAKSLDVKIMGAGDVVYSGSPTVTRQVHGAGDIRRAG